MRIITSYKKTLRGQIAPCQVCAQKDTHIFVVPLLPGRLSYFTAVVYNSPQHSKENNKMCLQVKLRGCAC